MRNSRYLPYLIWLFPLLFFTYQFILRLWPGLMMHQIMEQFSIDASHFGLLAAFYYYGYAGMQIPVAILLDRFGAKIIVFIFALICGVASIAFTFTDNFHIALLSRFFVGVGSAVGFLGISKVVSEWFPKEQYARMIGFSFTVGLMGAIFGGMPVNMLIESYGWQNVALVLAAVSIMLGVGAYLVLEKPVDAAQETGQFKKSNFAPLFSSPIIWLLAASNLLMVGSLEGFADVWGVQYLMIAYDLSKSDAAGLASFIFFGMVFGGPLLAFCSKKSSNYTVIISCGVGMAFMFAMLLLTEHYNWWLLAGIFFVMGLMCCYQVIVFAAGSELVTPESLGVTIAFLNCINMLGGSFFHTIIGRVMDMFWTGSLGEDGLRIYDLQAYKYALSVAPVCAIIGAILVFVVSVKTKRV